MERLRANLARLAATGAPVEPWERADPVDPEDARRNVPPTNQRAPARPTARSPNPNQRWREGHSDVSLYLMQEVRGGRAGAAGWDVAALDGNGAMQRLGAFVQHELGKVEKETYFLRDPARGDSAWITRGRVDDISEAIRAAHAHAGLALPGGVGLTEMQLRVMSKLFILVHLRALDAISARARGSDRFVDICNSFDLDSLVENVHHMLVYRAEVRRAKSGNAGSATTPIADGIRKQYARNTELDDALSKRGYPDGHDADDPGDLAHVNPPMLPMFCSAPPRMGKSAVALLVGSLAVKLGGRVFYAVAPNKVVPVNEMLSKVRSALQWTPRPPAASRQPKRQRPAIAAPPTRTTGQGLLVNEHDRPMHDNLHIVFYSHHVPTTELSAVLGRIDALSKTAGEWVLHVRDEAQFLVKDSAYHYKEGRSDKSIPEYEPGWRRPPDLLARLRATYPLKCGLSLCVSATLLPVLTETQLVGRVPLAVWGRVDAGDWGAFATEERDRRDHDAALGASEARAPRMVAVLSPQRGNLVMSDATTPRWIRKHYRDVAGVERSYHGTMAHVRPWKAAADAEITYMSDGMWELDEASVATSLPELKHQLALLQAEGDPSVPGMPRVCSPVVFEPSADAEAVLSHAREWLAEARVSAKTSDGQAAVFHPMYLLSPTRTQRGDGGTADWVQQIFKHAWLRMHREFDEGALPADVRDAAGLRRRYGMVALVYASDENDVERRRFSRSLQSGADLAEGELLVYCFDPVEAENRLPEHDFARLRPGSDVPAGTMRASATSIYVEKARREPLNERMAALVAEAKRERRPFPSAELRAMLDGASTRKTHAFDRALPTHAGTSLENLNGVVLKLTTTRHANAQSAIGYYHAERDIEKVLVSGYSMMSAGLTLQHSKHDPSRGWWHWVPKYFAVATVRKQLSLSESYQLVGRSFVDLRGGAELPPDWKVQLLAAQYVVPVLTLYSRLELRFAMLRDMPLAQVMAHLSQFCSHPAIALHFEHPANLLAQFYRSQLSRQERKDGLVWHLLRMAKPPPEDAEIEFAVPEAGLVVGARGGR